MSFKQAVVQLCRKLPQRLVQICDRAGDNIAANGHGSSGFVGGDTEHLGTGHLHWFQSAFAAALCRWCCEKVGQKQRSKLRM